jgi:hypothetical protein
MKTREVLSLSDALKRQRPQLGSRGLLDLSSVRFPNDGLAKLGTQNALVELRLNGCPLTSLVTLSAQPKLKTIIADDSRVAVLAGLERQAVLVSISFVNTPVAQVENFRLAALIVAPQLSSINGAAVTRLERSAAAAYPPAARDLVTRGWIVRSPPPSTAEFRFLADEFAGDAGADSKPPSPSARLTPRSPPTPTRERAEVSWPAKLAAVLVALGFPVRSGREMNQDIVKAVKQLCDVAIKVESLAEPRE